MANAALTSLQFKISPIGQGPVLSLNEERRVSIWHSSSHLGLDRATWISSPQDLVFAESGGSYRKIADDKILVREHNRKWCRNRLNDLLKDRGIQLGSVKTVFLLFGGNDCAPPRPYKEDPPFDLDLSLAGAVSLKEFYLWRFPHAHIVFCSVVPRHFDSSDLSDAFNENRKALNSGLALNVKEGRCHYVDLWPTGIPRGNFTMGGVHLRSAAHYGELILRPAVEWVNSQQW